VGAGRAYLFNGATGDLVRQLASPAAPDSEGAFAYSVAGLSDVDGDGLPDVST
jgi:hypothetical protein